MEILRPQNPTTKNTPAERRNIKNNADYSMRLVDDYLEFRGGIDAEVDEHLERAEQTVERHRKSASLGAFSIDEAAARAFYDTMIRPYLLKGKLNGDAKEKTFVPDKDYIDDFVSTLSQGSAVSQMYIRLLQSRPGEEPTDSRIGYGALELIRTWSVRTKVAAKLGLDYSVNIVDETEAFDHGEQLGFSKDAINDSYLAMGYLLDRYGISASEISITPFSRQASLYREGEAQDDVLTAKYEQLLEGNIEKTAEDLKTGIFSLSAIRAVMIHKLRHGDSFPNVSANRDFEYLSDFSKDDVDESLLVSESFNSALQMRQAAKQHIADVGLQAAFPEFFHDSSFHWGISKKADRLSIQPNFKVHKGRLVTPGYALPLYGEGQELMGLVSYTEHTNDGFETIHGPNDLPTALAKLE
jgi:hypothetical protein